MTMKMNDDPFNFGTLKFPELNKRKLEDFLNDRLSMARPRENQSVYFMGGKITLDHGDIPTRVLDSPMSNSYMIECIVYGGSKQTMTAVSEQTDTYNVVTIENALDKILSLRGVEYDRKDKENKHEVGLIAQEVEKVVPEVVSYSDALDLKSVSYGNIVGILVEAIKEQQSQINELKNTINGLLLTGE